MKTQKGYGIIRERSDDMARKTHTSTEVKRRWNDKTYRRYVTYLRYDTDKDLIDWIESHKEEYGTTNIFRDAVRLLIETNKD